MVYLLLMVAMAAGICPHLATLSPVFGGLLYGGARLRRQHLTEFYVLWTPAPMAQRVGIVRAAKAQV